MILDWSLLDNVCIVADTCGKPGLEDALLVHIAKSAKLVAMALYTHAHTYIM